MGTVELLLGGIAVLSAGARLWVEVRRAQAVKRVIRTGASPVSFAGRILVTALLIVGVQWWVVRHLDDPVWWWVALGAPALVTAITITKALYVVRIDRSSQQPGDRW